MEDKVIEAVLIEKYDGTEHVWNTQGFGTLANCWALKVQLERLFPECKYIVEYLGPNYNEEMKKLEKHFSDGGTVRLSTDQEIADKREAGIRKAVGMEYFKEGE